MKATFRLASGSLLLGLVCLEGSAASGSYDSLRLSVDPAVKQFASHDPVRLRILLENVGHPCMPYIVDPVFFPAALPHRPVVVLQLMVTDGKGRSVTPAVQANASVSGIRPAEFVFLDCGTVYGMYISLADAEWGFRLNPGHYRVRATAESRVATFLRGRPETLRQLGMARGLTSKVLDSFLRDFAVQSEEAVFEVAP
jgi:hypothetical protein